MEFQIGIPLAHWHLGKVWYFRKPWRIKYLHQWHPQQFSRAGSWRGDRPPSVPKPRHELFCFGSELGFPISEIVSCNDQLVAKLEHMLHLHGVRVPPLIAWSREEKNSRVGTEVCDRVYNSLVARCEFCDALCKVRNIKSLWTHARFSDLR